MPKPTDEQMRLLNSYMKQFWMRQLEKCKNNKNIIDKSFLEEYVNDPLSLNQPKFHCLNPDNLDIAEGYPIAYRDQDGIIAVQLRPIKHKKLLLGCGNNPTSICFHEPHNINLWKHECNCYSNDPEWAQLIIQQKLNENKCKKFHYHKGYTTIDPNIVMNPDVVGFFGDEILDCIPSDFFDSISTEGIMLNSCKFYDTEVMRVIKNKTHQPIIYDLG